MIQGRTALLLFVFWLLVPGSIASAGDGFGADFTGRAMRLDFHHVGHATTEIVSLRQVQVEGEWPGSRTELVDTLNLGKYHFEIADLATNRVLFSRGFSSIYGEWEVTGPARKGTFRTFEEALRFPEPKRPFQVRLRKRDDRLAFREIWSTTVDPASRFVDRSPVARYDIHLLQENGPPAEKVDVLLLGDGYTSEERAKFHADAEKAAEALFRYDPFKARRADFNVRAVFAPAALSGVSRPRAGVFRDSPLGSTYNSFDSERYVLTFTDWRWRDVAATAPYDFVIFLMNSRQYGGGGIYNLFSTAAADSNYADYLVIHEFGHHFAGLGDEYYTSSVAYEEFTPAETEPWEPNVTALIGGKLKWSHLATEGIPLPTPWEKEEYERRSIANQKRRSELRARGATEDEVEALFDEERKGFTEFLGGQKHAGQVGAFEGAGYEARGLYRPSVDCIMFTRNDVGFCKVCAEALTKVIDAYSR